MFEARFEMPPDPKLSVVIPAFNAGSFIGATLESIARQQYPNVEVILVDALSQDGTVAAARTYGEHFHLTIIQEPDRGQLDGLQKGLAAASGDVILWMNADDIVMPGAFRYVMKTFADHPGTDFVYSDDFAFDEATRDLFAGPPLRGLTDLDHVLFYRQMCSECVYWRAEITRYLPQSMFDLRVYTDYAFMLNLRWGRRGRWVPKRLGAFRIRDGQMSSTMAQGARGEFARIRAAHLRAVGIGASTASLLRCLHAPSFFLRHVLALQSIRATRRVCRFLDRDAARNRLKRFFFEEWVAPSPAPPRP